MTKEGEGGGRDVSVMGRRYGRQFEFHHYFQVSELNEQLVAYEENKRMETAELEEYQEHQKELELQRAALSKKVDCVYVKRCDLQTKIEEDWRKVGVNSTLVRS